MYLIIDICFLGLDLSWILELFKGLILGVEYILGILYVFYIDDFIEEYVIFYEVRIFVILFRRCRKIEI